MATRIEYLGLLPVETVTDGGIGSETRSFFSRRVRAQDITVFTSDLALLLKADARIDDALELLRNPL